MPHIVSAPPPRRRELWFIRVLIVAGLAVMVNFIFWFLQPEHVGFVPLYWVLNISFGYKMLRILHEWYHYSSLSVPQPPPVTREWKVDMLTTFCPGEPYDMIERTLKAMKAVRYPHETYLCDEGNDPYIKELCAELGVHHVYRGEDKTHAKAGNINFALRTRATGEIAIILDPDHVPIPDMIDRVLPFFEDPEIGYVQSVQAYVNRNESFVAKGAAEQTYQFYGPMMMSMNSYGTAQAIGANCAFRREALDSIGGHAPGLAEDMHTAMQLHAKGWKSVYLPEILTRGLVPATLSGYFKQQLKWSRGVFELLFFVYPQLFRRFTWRQKLHYLLIPLHFLQGVVTLIDIVVPILALVLARPPWHVDLLDFIRYLLPLGLITVLIRQLSQRWVMEEHERGFHFIGGTLLAGSWWVLLVGFVYTFFRVKVPYIPTPKDDQPTNELRLNRPNLIVIGLSLAAIAYGLYLDWNPYNWVMAGFAFTNVLVLGMVVVIGQQKSISWAYSGLYGKRFFPVRATWYRFRHKLVYRFMRNGYIISAGAAIMVMLSFAIIDFKPTVNLSRLAYNEIQRVDAGFYTGGTLVPTDQDWTLQPVQAMESALGQRASVVALPMPAYSHTQGWAFLRQLNERGNVPLLTWDLRQLAPADSLPASDSALHALVASGRFEPLVRTYARQIAHLPGPVFLEVQPAAAASWTYLHARLTAYGASNVAWTWAGGNPTALAEAFPGSAYVDWVGVKVGQAPVKGRLDSLQGFLAQTGLPVMLTDLPADAEALASVPATYPQVKGMVMASEAFADLPVRTTPLFAGLTPPPFRLLRPAMYPEGMAVRVRNDEPGVEVLSGISGDRNHFSLTHQGKPLYIKGVVYHPSPHWFEGSSPLTRRQLEADFDRLQAMGANTIRRYAPDVYDVNVLRVAREKGMQVLFGFELNPHVDYYADTARLQKLAQGILDIVATHRDEPSIIGWTLGNETWSRLRHKYPQPYLSQVRQGYLVFVENLTREIHRLSPGKPVFAAMEFTPHLPAALEGYRVYAPSVDVMGVNTLYIENLVKLDSITQVWYPERPYVSTEFGPGGYWHEDLTERDGYGYVQETSSFEKGLAYAHRWRTHIAPHQGRNLGGFAYSWRDQHEGTSTWYGLTDMHSRLKPAYFALQTCWADSAVEPPLRDAYISPPDPYWYRQEELTFMSVSENNRQEHLTFEWFLSPEQIAGARQGLYKAGTGPRVTFALPDPSITYRLYLYISDENGHVVTASQIANP